MESIFDSKVDLPAGYPAPFEGHLKRMKLNSEGGGFGLLPRPGMEIDQHLTICLDGRVYLNRYAFINQECCFKTELYKRQQFRIKQTEAAYLLSLVAMYFAFQNEPCFATDVGMWELELENTDGKIFRYHGSMCADFSVDGLRISPMIRKYLSMPDLLCFDSLARVPIQTGPGEYIFIHVRFEGNNQTYCYISEDNLVREYDKVIVPVGDGHETKIVTVASVTVATAENAPYPIEQCKKMIGRAE